jgi:hypothetical protein
MNHIQWRYPKGAVTEADINAYEKAHGISFPADYRAIVLEHNGERPRPNSFDTRNTKGRVADILLSFNRSDRVNIWDVTSWLKDSLPLKIVPIISDPGGNYICYDFTNPSPTIVFWNHETDLIEEVCNTFTQLLDMLK